MVDVPVGSNLLTQGQLQSWLCVDNPVRHSPIVPMFRKTEPPSAFQALIGDDRSEVSLLQSIIFNNYILNIG